MKPALGPGPVQDRRPFSELGIIQEVDGVVNSNYNALSVKVQQRYSDGLTYLVGYTWSRAIDTGSAIRNHAGDSLFPQNSYDISLAERGLSNFHVAHRFVASALWDIPVGRAQNGWVDAVIGGWQVGSIVTLQNGLPFTVFHGSDVANIGQGFQRPNATGAEVDLKSGVRDPQMFFNTAGFSAPDPFTFGNAGRNSVIGPGLIGWDFSVMKNIPVMEGHELQFRFEAFNFPNRPNFGLPNATFLSPSFGRISSTATTMREIQFGLKYLF